MLPGFRGKHQVAWITYDNRPQEPSLCPAPCRAQLTLCHKPLLIPSASPTGCSRKVRGPLFHSTSASANRATPTGLVSLFTHSTHSFVHLTNTVLAMKQESIKVWRLDCLALNLSSSEQLSGLGKPHNLSLPQFPQL